jgi:hypothetical protein
VTISRRERRLLGMLSVLALVWGLWQLRALARTGTPASSAPPRPAADASRPTRAGARGHAGALPERVVELALDRLDVAPRDLAAGRDPFRFAPHTPPPPPPLTPEELAARQREQEERQRAAAERAAAEAARPHPPDVDVRYLGSFGPRARPIAVFADTGGANVYNAREGDTLEGKFIVQRIGYESVDLAFVGYPDVPAQRLGLTQ